MAGAYRKWVQGRCPWPEAHGVFVSKGEDEVMVVLRVFVGGGLVYTVERKDDQLVVANTVSGVEFTRLDYSPNQTVLDFLLRILKVVDATMEQPFSQSLHVLHGAESFSPDKWKYRMRQYFRQGIEPSGSESEEPAQLSAKAPKANAKPRAQPVLPKAKATAKFKKPASKTAVKKTASK